MATADLLNGISSAGSTTSATQPKSSFSDRAKLTRDDFYKIMISELSNQDPFQPLDNQQFLQQLSSLQTLDVTGKLNDGIDKLVLGQKLAGASSLIGRQVHAPDATNPGSQINGTVQKVQVEAGDVELVLDGNRKVKLSDVVEIE